MDRKVSFLVLWSEILSGQGASGMLRSSLEAVIVLYYILLDGVQNREQREGKGVAHLPTQQLPQQP